MRTICYPLVFCILAHGQCVSAEEKSDTALASARLLTLSCLNAEYSFDAPLKDPRRGGKPLESSWSEMFSGPGGVGWEYDGKPLSYAIVRPFTLSDGTPIGECSLIFDGVSGTALTNYLMEYVGAIFDSSDTEAFTRTDVLTFTRDGALWFILISYDPSNPTGMVIATTRRPL